MLGHTVLKQRWTDNRDKASGLEDSSKLPQLQDHIPVLPCGEFSLPPTCPRASVSRVVPALTLEPSPSILWVGLFPHPSPPHAEFLLPWEDLAVLFSPLPLISYLSQKGLSLQFTSFKTTLKSPKSKSRIPRSSYHSNIMHRGSW